LAGALGAAITPPRPIAIPLNMIDVSGFDMACTGFDMGCTGGAAWRGARGFTAANFFSFTALTPERSHSVLPARMCL
jgi:hypothetical protein